MKLNELYKIICSGDFENKITPKIALMERVSIRRAWAEPDTPEEWLFTRDFTRDIDSQRGFGSIGYKHEIITIIYDEIVKLYVNGKIKLLTDSDYVLRVEGKDINGDLHTWDIWSF